LRLTEDEENQTGAEYTHNMIKSQPLTNTTLHTGTAKVANHCFNKLAVTQGITYLQLNHPEDRPDSLQEKRAIC
jgi:arsenate reductase-like glutaredoxin family protein